MFLYDIKEFINYKKVIASLVISYGKIIKNWKISSKPQKKGTIFPSYEGMSHLHHYVWLSCFKLSDDFKIRRLRNEDEEIGEEI